MRRMVASTFGWSCPHKGATFEHVREGRGMESVDADIEAHLEAHGVPRV